MGEVWRARDTRLDRDVALKVLPAAFVADPERLARFEREAKVLASLNHPHIGGIYGIDEAHADGGAVKALVLELVEGPTLADRIARGPISLDEALPIARQIAEALEAAHEQGIIHRDLKPANIKVRPDGAVKVLDFGLAKALQPPLQAAAGDEAALSHSPTLTLGGAATQMGVILGTAAYMSPEQARGRPVDKRADLWAFGCVLYEMLTGRRALAGSDVTDTMAAVLRAEPDWSALPVETPPAARRLLRRCLQKDPRERIRDAGDVRLELIEPAEPPGLAVAAPRRHERALRWLFGAGALAIVVALLAASYGVGARRAAASHPTVEWRGEQLGGPTAFGPRISPDGQMLAFAAMVDGLTQVGIMLGVRSVDHPHQRSLAGRRVRRRLGSRWSERLLRSSSRCAGRHLSSPDVGRRAPSRARPSQDAGAARGRLDHRGAPQRPGTVAALSLLAGDGPPRPPERDRRSLHTGAISPCVARRAARSCSTGGPSTVRLSTQALTATRSVPSISNRVPCAS
jgi:hypothetical protein